MGTRSGGRRGLTGLLVVIVLGVMVTIVAFLAPPRGGSDSFGTDVTYADAAKQEPVSVVVTYSASSRRTESYPLRLAVDSSVPVSWAWSGTGTAGTISLRQGGRALETQPLSGSGCVHWTVTGETDYQVAVTVGPGDGTARVGWSDGAECG